jgi:hypothetical protein
MRRISGKSTGSCLCSIQSCGIAVSTPGINNRIFYAFSCKSGLGWELSEAPDADNEPNSSKKELCSIETVNFSKTFQTTGKCIHTLSII